MDWPKRDDMKKMIDKYGDRVTGAVNSKTSYLISGVDEFRKVRKRFKYTKAEGMSSCKIIDENDLFKLMQHDYDPNVDSKFKRTQVIDLQLQCYNVDTPLSGGLEEQSRLFNESISEEPAKEKKRAAGGKEDKARKRKVRTFPLQYLSETSVMPFVSLVRQKQ